MISFLCPSIDRFESFKPLVWTPCSGNIEQQICINPPMEIVPSKLLIYSHTLSLSVKIFVKIFQYEHKLELCFLWKSISCDIILAQILWDRCFWYRSVSGWNLYSNVQRAKSSVCVCVYMCGRCTVAEAVFASCVVQWPKYTDSFILIHHIITHTERERVVWEMEKECERKQMEREGETEVEEK